VLIKLLRQVIPTKRNQYRKLSKKKFFLRVGILDDFESLFL